MKRLRLVFALGIALSLRPVVGSAQETPAAPTPSPAPPSPYVSIEEEASPTYDREAGSSNVINLRVQLPYIAGAQYLLRLRMPIVTSAPATAVTGAGDLALYDLGVRDSRRSRWLEGIVIRIPTAQNDSLGTGKYSLGPAVGYQTREGPWTLGFFQQSFFSVIGPKSRSPVGQSKIQPVASLALPQGWSVGLSSMNVTYDWVRNRWTELPVGLQIDKSFGDGLRPLDASFEVEKNLADTRGAPAWTLRALLQWTFYR